MAEKKRIPLWSRILMSTFLLLSVLVVGFVIWGSTPARPMPEAVAAAGSEPSGDLLGGAAGAADESWLTFVPDGGPPTTGLILYPGGRVDFRAYAPAAQAIADQGYLVVLVRMPLNLAVFDPNMAEAVIAGNPQIEHWAVGGHSLGGAMAANFVYTHPDAVDGLVLWAAYPAESNDLSGSDVQVLSISASLDGLSTPDTIAASAALLPQDTLWVVIEGGNHAQFGWYGEQAGDNPATITREEQQAQIVEATLALLAAIQ
jgi:pimeloyl-ACP methyl ester carboxylesterase